MGSAADPGSVSSQLLAGGSVEALEDPCKWPNTHTGLVSLSTGPLRRSLCTRPATQGGLPEPENRPSKGLLKAWNQSGSPAPVGSSILGEHRPKGTRCYTTEGKATRPSSTSGYPSLKCAPPTRAAVTRGTRVHGSRPPACWEGSPLSSLALHGSQRP